MLPGVDLTEPVTPSLPLPPRPTGHLTLLPAPTLVFHSGETLARKSVNTAVVPEPSERWTTVIAWSGSFEPGLAAAILGSFQRVILPRKISATLSELSLSC